MIPSTMATLGERLRKARESKTLTIDQVQKQTRIHSTVLIALEEGRCDKMLTPTYVKSFLKKYALHLGLDIGEIMDAYLAANPDARGPEQKAPSPESGRVERRPVDIAGMARAAAPYVAGVLALVVAVSLGGRVLSFLKAGRAPRIVVAEKKPAVKTKKPLPEKAVPEKAVSAKAAAPAKEAPKAEEPAAPAAQERPAAAKREGIVLVLKAKRDVFVTARTDGVIAFKRHLPKGTTETLKADDSINLAIARGEAVELFLNGKQLAPLNRGYVRDLEITRRGARSK